ncbi:MAG: class I SAM-dependent methyltransferase [Bacillota bacterium]|nr:class I SAM-dependent methyltransferase [Bacillota bacterium]
MSFDHNYGQDLRRLNPLEAAEIGHVLAAYCPPQAAVLDVGCGRGETLRWLAAHSEYRLSGVEADAEYAAICNAVVGRAEQLPFADGSFDALLLQCVFSLLDEPKRAAQEAWRVLRAGGVLLLCDLYGRAGEAELRDNRLLRHIYAARTLCGFFTASGFSERRFTDYTAALQALLGQMIFDGTACDCLDESCRAALKQARAGYGLWVLQK